MKSIQSSYSVFQRKFLWRFLNNILKADGLMGLMGTAVYVLGMSR